MDTGGAEVSEGDVAEAHTVEKVGAEGQKRRYLPTESSAFELRMTMMTKTKDLRPNTL